MSSSMELSRRRTRGATTSARNDALERLKALRRGGRREMNNGGFQVKIEQPIYDTVDDDEYKVLVAKRREDVKGFIIDDNGLGYGDQGQEEDWSNSGAAEESDAEFERPKKKKSNSENKSAKKPSALASKASALMGKQRISSMFTSSVFKKDIPNNFTCNSIVDDVIAEFAPDESDRERRRRTALSVCPVKIEKTVDNDNYLRVCPVKIKKSIDSDNYLHIAERGTNSQDMIRYEEIKENSEERLLDDDEVKDPAPSAIVGVRSAGIDGSGPSEKLDFEVESDGSLPFYMLDAHEEIYGANAGNVYLFGKVKSGAAYHSCCVVVQNMWRCVFAIPTVSFLHDATITELEKKIEESRISLMACKDTIAKQGTDGEKELASGLKAEISKELQ
ncbi:hypothetical protein OROMI_008158 [Orobanche minor]